MGLGVMPLVVQSMTLFCDNEPQSKELRNKWKDKHIERSTLDS